MNTQFVLNVDDVDVEAYNAAMPDAHTPLINRSTLRIIGFILSIMAVMFIATFLHSYPACIPIAVIVAICAVVYRNMAKENKQ